MPLRQLLRAFLLALLLGLPGVAAPSKPFVFRGQSFQFLTYNVDGKQFLSLEDREVKRLIDLTLAQVQFSSAGTSLYFFLPGRQTFWSDRSDTMTLNGLDVAAPGLFLADRKMMERQALFLALGLRAFEERENWNVFPVVTSIGVEGAKPIDPQAPVDVKPVIIKFSAPSKPVIEPAVEGWFQVEVPDVAWDDDASSRTLHFQEAECQVVGGDKSGKPLVLRFHLRPYWEAKLQLNLGGWAQVTFEPRHLAAAPSAETRLGGIEVAETASNSSDGGVEKQFRFLLDKPTQFSWTQTTDSALILEFPAASVEAGSSIPEGCKLFQLTTTRYPVVRFETQIPAGQAFDFAELDKPPHTLMLRLAPKGRYKSPDSQGMAITTGFSAGGSATVVIDPGHGGGDSGCQNRALGVYEKDVTLDISLRLQRLLQQRGWKVIMTRSEDRDVTYAGSPDAMELEARANVANNSGADIFVSIHCNASVNSGARGSSVYWWKDEDYPLAQSLDILGESLGFEEKGVIQNRFAVLRMTGMPAALVETAFLTNPTEGAMLADANVRQAIAERLAMGLQRYMQQYSKKTTSATKK